MWPISGQNGPTMSKSLKEFLGNKLRLPSTFIRHMGEISIKRVAAGPGAKIADEVIVVFATVETRDAVKRAARELAGARDTGIRLEIPQAMQPSLKALEAISYHLKQRHPGMKRNIKFDDHKMELVLDFNTDPDGTGGWRQVDAGQARQMKTKIRAAEGRTTAVSDQELDTMLACPVAGSGS